VVCQSTPPLRGNVSPPPLNSHATPPRHPSPTAMQVLPPCRTPCMHTVAHKSPPCHITTPCCATLPWDATPPQCASPAASSAAPPQHTSPRQARPWHTLSPSTNGSEGSNYLPSPPRYVCVTFFSHFLTNFLN
jgi:hypothetical protein